MLPVTDPVSWTGSSVRSQDPSCSPDRGLTNTISLDKRQTDVTGLYLPLLLMNKPGVLVCACISKRRSDFRLGGMHHSCYMQAVRDFMKAIRGMTKEIKPECL